MKHRISSLKKTATEIFKPGDYVVFNFRENEADWDKETEAELKQHDHEDARILGIATYGDVNDGDTYYYDIVFKDGSEAAAISIFHLSPKDTQQGVELKAIIGGKKGPGDYKPLVTITGTETKTFDQAVDATIHRFIDMGYVVKKL